MSDELPDDAAATPSVTPPQRTRGGAGSWAPPSPQHLQRLLPQYEVIEMLGHGGMGAVYKARQISLDRLVAIKILPPEILGDEDANFVERFKNEARTMARMNHPGIVAVHDFGQTPEGQLYFVMEFVDGTDVAKMLRSQGRLSADYALAITAHVCDALQYSHTHGVIHRDIKPANVLINMEGQVKVADFGLAKGKDAAPGTGLTRTNMTMGTPDFVAPEALIAGMETDHRADLYAVGVMLYNMLTGEIPRGRFKPASEKAGCDPRFDAIINKAMESERAERYQTALNLRRDLDVILTTPVVQAGDKKGSAATPGQAAPQGIARKPVSRQPGRSPAHPAAPHGRIGPRRSSAGKIAAILALVAAMAAGMIFVLKKPLGQESNATPGATELAVENAAGSRAAAPATPPAEPRADSATSGGNAKPASQRSGDAPRRSLEPRAATPAASATPPNIGTRAEVWNDWLAELRKSGAAPGGFTWEGEALRSSGARYAMAICGAAPIRDGALRVTFVPTPVEKLQPTLFIRRSSLPGPLKSYAGSVVPSGKRVVLSVMGKSATASENHPAALPAGFDPEGEFTVELRAEGDAIGLSVNGEKALSIRDTRFREGVPAFNAPEGYLVKKVEVLNLDSGPAASTAIPAVGGPAGSGLKPGSAEAAPVVDLAMRESLRRDLVSQWHGDGDARDSAGNNHGTIHNVTFAPGVRAQAFDFAAADSAVVMPVEALNEDYSALTIFAWVNPRSHGAADDNNYGRTVLSRTKDGGFALRVFNGLIQANLRTDAGNGKIGFGEKPLQLHQWSMIAITYDGARVLAYQDGKRVGGQGSHGGKIKKTGVSTARLMIGNDPGDDAKDSTRVQRGHFGWDGAIDMVTFYSRALSAGEIAAAYELTRKK